MNNFKDYGFEADFEGEILKEIEDMASGKVFIGYIVYDCKVHSCIWQYNGIVITRGVNQLTFNLKPIKKEWYENIDCNKPAHFIDLETNTLGLAHGYNMNGDYCLNDFWKNSLSHISNARPATKEEILALLVKE